MALSINTESLKTLSNMVIECKHAEQLGIYVFNNLNNTTAEYMELCKALEESCKKIENEIQKLKPMLPVTI